MIVLTNNGRLSLIENFVAEEMTVHLFTSSNRPDPNDNVDDYTEVSGNGYSPIRLDPEKWDINDEYVAQYPSVTFLLTGSVGSVYGYYITNSDGKLTLAERFEDGPYIVQSNGHRISVNIAIA